MNEQLNEFPLLFQHVNKIEIDKKREHNSNSNTNKNTEFKELNDGGDKVHIVVSVYYVAVNVMQMRQNTQAIGMVNIGGNNSLCLEHF